MAWVVLRQHQSRIILPLKCPTYYIILTLPTHPTPMFHIQLRLLSLTAPPNTTQSPRLYLRLTNIHYFISQRLHIVHPETPLAITSSFYLPEQQPTFELMLLLQLNGKQQQVMGKVRLDARQWPLFEEKTKQIGMSHNISILACIKATFLTLQEMNWRGVSGSQLDVLQQRHKQIEITQLNAYLQQRNLTLQQAVLQLQAENAQLEQNKLLKQKQLLKRQQQRQKQKEIALQELAQLKQELSLVNVQIGELANLVNSHGEIDICNSLLALLAKQTHP